MDYDSFINTITAIFIGGILSWIVLFQVGKAFTAHIGRPIASSAINVISVSGMAASNKSTSGSAVFFFFTIMTSEMKLDDLVQERQLPHLELC